MPETSLIGGEHRAGRAKKEPKVDNTFLAICPPPLK